jgi:hypothetical protein
MPRRTHRLLGCDPASIALLRRIPTEPTGSLQLGGKEG